MIFGTRQPAIFMADVARMLHFMCIGTVGNSLSAFPCSTKELFANMSTVLQENRLKRRFL